MPSHGKYLLEKLRDNDQVRLNIYSKMRANTAQYKQESESIL